MNRAKLFWLGVATAGMMVFGGCSVGGVSTETVCDDAIDDDKDGFVDCEDTDCRDAPVCSTNREVACGDGVDNDGDGAVDCADSDCEHVTSCQTGSELCTNGIDDDGDGAADCDDLDCQNNVACQEPENCANGIDDDGDNFVDCEDADCYSHVSCEPASEDCTNGIDDDGDGAADCADSECASHSSCQTPSENCTNGMDDDGDGAADCADSDCASHSSCQAQSGDLSCMGLDMCYRCCVSGDSACYDACYAEGSATAQAQDDAVVSCLENNCYYECTSGTSEECSTCAQTYCSYELNACDWDPTGFDSCVDLNNCLNTCSSVITDGSGSAAICPTQSGLICFDDCFGGADQDAIDKFYDYNSCYWDNCEYDCADPNSTTCDTCIQTYCQTQLDACVND